MKLLDKIEKSQFKEMWENVCFEFKIKQVKLS